MRTRVLVRECVLDVGRPHHHTPARRQGRWLPVDIGLVRSTESCAGPRRVRLCKHSPSATNVNYALSHVPAV